jgi:hypothetical protein
MVRSEIEFLSLFSWVQILVLFLFSSLAAMEVWLASSAIIHCHTVPTLEPTPAHTPTTGDVGVGKPREMLE